jgi:hypothetical protein
MDWATAAALAFAGIFIAVVILIARFDALLTQVYPADLPKVHPRHLGNVGHSR